MTKLQFSNCLECKNKIEYYQTSKEGKFCSHKCSGKYRTLPSNCRYCKKHIPKKERYNSKFNFWMRTCKPCGRKRVKQARRRLKKLYPIKYKARSLRTSLLNNGIKTLHVTDLIQIIHNTQKCSYCEDKITFKNISIDHIQPISRGGLKDSLTNIHFICLSCNMIKGNLTHDEYKKLLQFLLANPSIYSLLKIRLKFSGWMYNRK